MNVNFSRERLLAAVLIVLISAVFLTLTLAVPARGQSSDQSPDGLWQILGEVPLPEGFSPPRTYTALSLDAELLDHLLVRAPRETFGPIPPQTQIWVPLPTGEFVQIALARSQLMEPGLAARFPQIATYVFDGSASGLTGHLVQGPRGTRATAQAGAELLRIEPVETAAGRIYLSYFDSARTDGANIIEHDPDEHEHDEEEPPPVPRLGALTLTSFGARNLGINAIQAGEQLRIYRLAASTTGEFFQARDTGNGAVDVVDSLTAEVAGANAVFEPEVSVRLVLADVTSDVLYDDPATDPFDNSRTPCQLRDDNRDNMMAVLDDADYDLGFLFATGSGGGASGCAWFVVCQTSSNTLHKARGAGKMGNNGANAASGLMAHEIGHQLGARHTFSGQDGSCTLVEFQAGDSESAYEPGSGTTRMSYNGNCATDDVDVSAVPAGSYFHSRSFDEIVDNVFNGDGATCGTLAATGNLAPDVDAGPDYTIPRQTPFTLSGSATDNEPLIYNWEQYDRALTQRPIDTDPGDGPIIRSIPPGADATRTIPRMQDLLDNVTRKGEILPQVDRELNFRLIARDNLMGGGGVSYDETRLTVLGSPFFITAPNSGAIEAACTVPLTWEVGGGSVAAQVEALFSDDGGQNFDVPLTGPVTNDGADSFVVPCATTNAGRIKLQSVGNIFFDVNDQNLSVFNTPPTVEVATSGGSVDENCAFTVEFSATAADACGLPAANVEVDFVKGGNNYTLGTPVVNTQQLSANEVGISGSVVVSDLQSSPAQLSITVTATDACGASTSDTAQADVVDDTPPQIDVTLSPSQLWPPNHKLVPIQATVVASDNCPGVGVVLTSLVSSEPDNGTGDGDTINDIQNAAIGTPDQSFELRSERVGSGSGRIYTATYTATDGSGNDAEDAATVTVPKSK